MSILQLTTADKPESIEMINSGPNDKIFCKKGKNINFCPF
jgi:hypothetical protein